MTTTAQETMMILLEANYILIWKDLEMKNTKRPLLLINKAGEPTIYDAPEPLALITKEKEQPDNYPFPLSREQQFELLYLMRSRKSGIITREELCNLIFIQPTFY